MLRLNWKLFVCVVALACFVGCPQVSDRPATFTVTGTVTLDGDPVPGATVAFSPKAVEGKAASGKTDNSGRFELTTFESGDGAVPGSYAVGVYKTEGPDIVGAGAPSVDDAYRAAEAAGQDVAGGGGGAQAKAAPGPKDLLPVGYKSPGTSGLTAQVTESGPNEFNFALTSEEGAAAPEAPSEASSDAPSE